MADSGAQGQYRKLLGLSPSAAPDEMRRSLIRELRLWTSRLTSASPAVRSEAQQRLDSLNSARVALLDTSSDLTLTAGTDLVLPVGYPLGFAGTEPVGLVRLGAEVVSVPEGVYVAWVRVHETPRVTELSPILGVSERESSQAIDALVATGLFARVPLEPGGARAVLGELRLLPTSFAGDLSADRVSLVSASGHPLAEVGLAAYLTLAYSDGGASVDMACSRAADELDLGHDLLLVQLAEALPRLLSVQAAVLDRLL